MRRTQGVSIMEAMVTMALISVALALTAGLMRVYSRSSRALDNNNNKLQAVRAVLHGVRTEAMGAVRIASPPGVSASWSSSLRFSKVDPTILDRRTALPADWTPYDLIGSAPLDDFLVEIEYRENTGKLERGFRKAGDSSFAYGFVPPQKIEGFSCRLNADQTLEIQIEVLGAAGTQIVKSKTLRRIP